MPQSFVLNRDGRAETVDVPFEGRGYQFEAIEVQRCLAEGLAESPLMPHATTMEIMHLMDEIRAQLPNYTQLDPALIESMGLPAFKSSLAPEDLAPLADAAVQFGIVEQEPKLDEVVWTPDK